MPRPPFRFALPPSLNVDGYSAEVSALRTVLREVVGGEADVTLSQTYEVMARNLLSGAVDAAWAPPLVCAKAEAEGLTVLAQAVRLGHAEYASAFVTRRGEGAPLAHLRRKRVVWVDPYSVAGYLLPVAHLESKGLSVSSFEGVGFAGSYRAALSMVREGTADLTCIHAHPTDKDAVARALVVHFPDGPEAFDVVEVTSAVPADAVVVSPEHAALHSQLASAFIGLTERDDGRRLLEALFLAERFQAPTPGAFHALHRVAPR